VIDRDDLGSWVAGPGGPRAPHGYRGERLGLPETGPGSLTGTGRRVAALLIDWVGCLLVARLLFPGLVATSDSMRSYDPRFSLAVLGLFALERVLLTWLGGASFGQRIVGSQVLAVGGRRAGLVRPLVRTLLLCLVVPALLWDSEGRGLHDRLAGTVELSVR
jgi:uncharacterized RDD family membrane protein YckC